MAKCPRCKEDMPLLSKICPVCGYVEDGDEASMSASELANELEGNLRDIKLIPQPSFGKSMGQLSYIMFPIIAMYILAMAIISEAGMFWILFILFLVLSVVFIVRKGKGKLGNDPFNRKFAEVKSEVEYNQRVARRSFGKNKEVSNLLNEIETEITTIEKQRKASGAKNLLLWVVILVVVFGLATGGVFKMNNALSSTDVENAAENVASNWQAAVEKLKGMSQSDPQIEQTRIDITKAILASNDGAAAESFFISYCMGQLKDYECAEQIVLYYVSKSDKEKATSFVESCTKMRYKSDVAKLKKLIK